MQEKIKICPFCREEISILARKCRYCGEMVGDPLKDERTLTADEIGQPDVTGTVRGETLAQAYSALQSKLEGEAVAAKRKRRRSSYGFRVKTVLPWLAAAGIVFALVAFRGTVTDFVNRLRVSPKETHARAYLKDANEAKRSGDVIEALRLTNEALTVYPDSRAAQDALQDLRAEIQMDLERMYRRKEYDQVNQFADRVLSVDPENEEVKMLANLAGEDRNRYSVRLLGIMTGANGQCFAAISTKIRGVVDVSQGDIFTDMRVEKIDEENVQVFVTDLKRGVSLRIGKEGLFEANP